MKPNYYDIIEKLGEPLWWDEHGVPRYIEFHPELASDIGAKYVALLEVACQDCGKIFKVASSVDPFYYRLYEREIHFPSSKSAGSFDYSDPPLHFEKCVAGYCMGSIPVRILEFWVRENWRIGWVRKPEYEVEFEHEEESDEILDELLKELEGKEMEGKV